MNPFSVGDFDERDLVGLDFEFKEPTEAELLVLAYRQSQSVTIIFINRRNWPNSCRGHLLDTLSMLTMGLMGR